MSFGDIGLTSINLSRGSNSGKSEPRRIGPRISAADAQITELQRLLKPLALNNASLRQTTHVLQDDARPSATTLKRMRALRDQNRNIASAAAALVSRLDASNPTTANLRASFKPLLDDFAALYTLSLRAEQNAVSKLSTLSPSSSSPSLANLPFRSLSHPELNSLVNADGTSSSNSSHSVINATPTHARSVSIELHAAMLDEEERRTSAAREAQSSQSVRSKTTEHAPLLSSSSLSSQQTLYRSTDVRDQFVSERRSAIHNVQATLEDVTSIFKDLAVMVDDQRSQVEAVDDAIEDSATRVSAGQRELVKTHERRNRHKSFFFCTLFSVASIIAVFLIILLS